MKRGRQSTRRILELGLSGATLKTPGRQFDNTVSTPGAFSLCFKPPEKGECPGAMFCTFSCVGKPSGASRRTRTCTNKPAIEVSKSCRCNRVFTRLPSVGLCAEGVYVLCLREEWSQMKFSPRGPPHIFGTRRVFFFNAVVFFQTGRGNVLSAPDAWLAPCQFFQAVLMDGREGTHPRVIYLSMPSTLTAPRETGGGRSTHAD